MTIEQASRDLEEDHHRIHGLVAEIRASRDRDRAVALLTTLGNDLAAHFDAEERPGGLYEVLGIHAPEFSRTLRHLLDDHFRLKATIVDLRDRVRAPSDPAFDMLATDVARLAAALGDHERREEEVVRAALARQARSRHPAPPVG